MALKPTKEQKEAADNATQGGSNLTAVKKTVDQAVATIRTEKLNRKKANERMASARADCEARGIPKKALAWGMQYAELGPEEREGHDLAYEIVREQLGYPVKAQGDLFTADDRARMRAELKEELRKEGDGEE